MKPPAHLDPLQQLATLELLSEDWDGYGAVPPTTVALKEARRLIRDVQRGATTQIPEASPYDVSPVPSGGIAIEWRGRSETLQLEVGPGGQLGYLLIVNGSDGRQFAEEENVPPIQVAKLLQQVLRS